VFGGMQPASMVQVPRPVRTAALTSTVERAHAINHLAWEFFTTPASISLAESYLCAKHGASTSGRCAQLAEESRSWATPVPTGAP
jgi:hypothetical protein